MIRVNEAVFDENLILQEMQYHTGTSQRDAMIKASESLIISELLKQRARTLGLLDQQADNVATEAVAEARLSAGKGFSTNKSEGSNIESAAVDDESFSEALFNQEVEMPSASEQDCRQYYDNNLDKFCTTPLLAVSHILLAADPENELARIEAEDTAKLLIRKLDKAGPSLPQVFAALAAEHSICPSKKTQGQLGQITKGQTVPEFERQLFNCDTGLVRKPLASRYGIHVVNIDQRVEGRQMEFVMVQKRIEDYLNEKVRRKAIAQYIEKLISVADIDGFDFSVSDSPLIQ